MIVVKRTDFTVIQIGDNKKMGQKQENNRSFWIPVKKNKIQIQELKCIKEPATFQSSLRATLIIGQIFSLIPFNGVLSNNASDVKFVWSSWKCLYLFLSLCGQIFLTLMCIHKVVHSVTSLNATTPVIFYGTTCITMVMFLQVARNWPALVHHVIGLEEQDPAYGTSLAKKCNVTCAIVLTLALLEHILSLLSAFAGAMVCYSKVNLYEGFVRHFYPWVFNFLPYSPLLGVLTQFLHFQSTFIWNFSDLFVICMSYYLTSRLDHVNKKLLAAQGKYLPEIFWRTTREDYGRAAQLVRKVDDVISGIVFISFANNLFFICLQLFNTLEDGIKGTGECSSRSKGFIGLAMFLVTYIILAITGSLARTDAFKQVSEIKSKAGHNIVIRSYNKAGLIFRSLDAKQTLSRTIKGNTRVANVMSILWSMILGGYEAATYFLFSLVYLITRSVAVSLIASQVNTASTVPAPVLYDVPSPVYCVEVQRFLDQVNGEKLALSGLQFFSVTRSLLLTVAGTIVTYELVMFQFNSPSSPTSTTSTALANITTTTPMPHA